MAPTPTSLAGIPLPSTAPLFLGALAIHVAAALLCVGSGLVAMLAQKGRGRHTRAGTIYAWAMTGVAGSMAALAAMRWDEDRLLFALGVAAFGATWLGRLAVRRRWRGRLRVHIAGMGASYVLLLIAFYVDNGRNLPLWRSLHPTTYWLLPLVIGAPLIARALLWHPLVKRDGSRRESRVP